MTTMNSYHDFDGVQEAGGMNNIEVSNDISHHMLSHVGAAK
jgi:hypothetical protein